MDEPYSSILPRHTCPQCRRVLQGRHEGRARRREIELVRGAESGARRAACEVASLARTCAVSTGRMPRSKSHAGGKGRRIWQVLREPRIESRINKLNRAFSLQFCAPGVGGALGSCPGANFARGPEIRAVQCVGGYRGKGRARGAPWLAGESRTPARTWQAYSSGPKEMTRACSRCHIDFLSAL